MKKSLWFSLLLAIACMILLSACALGNNSQTPNNHVHSFGEWTTVKKASCVIDGINERYCSCGEKQTQTIWALGHDETIDAAIAATCTTGGKTEGKHCSVCNETLIAQNNIPASHTDGEWVVDTNATCTVDGSKHQVCSVCNASIRTGTIAATDHTDGEWVVDTNATCTVDGSKHQVCSVCNASIKTETIAATGHTESDFVIDVPATIYVEGLQHTYCTICNEDVQTNVPVPRITSNGLAYEVNEDGTTCTITGIGTCTDTEIGIPDTIDGYIVTAIGENAFENCSSVTAIVLSNNIKSIGNRAFYKTSISEISLPASINKIGTQIFYGCNNLTTVYYAASYSPSQDTVFFNVSSIKTIVFNGSYVPSYICYDCDNIQTIVLADTVTSIGSYAFYECGNLKDLPYSENLSSIGGHSFERSGVETIHFSENVYIGYGAFFYCYELTSITFEGKVSNGWGPFRYCSAIPQINVPDLETWVYLQKLSLGGYDYEPFVATTLYINGTLLENAIIPDTVSVIPNFLFYNNQAIKSVVIPDSVSSIGKSAFYNCDNLVQVVLAESVGTIADSAFSSCNNLSLVFYSANEDDWNLMDVGSSNSSLTNATIYYNHNSIQEQTYTFEVNGGASIEAIKSTVGIILPIPTKENHYFGGWYEAANFNGNALSSLYFNSEDITLYAKWLTEEEYFAGTSFETAITMDTSEAKTVTIDTAGEKVYFKFVPSETKSYTISSQGGLDTYGHLYNSSTSQIASNDGGNDFSITYTLTAGETYYIAARMYSSSATGTFTITIS